MISRRKIAIAFVLSFVLAVSMFSGCARQQTGPQPSAADKVSESAPSVSEPAVSEPEPSTAPAEKTVVRVGVLKGPSSLGMLGLMDKNDKGEAENRYDFTIGGAPADIQTKLLSGELDIAAIPTNLGSVLYNKTDKNISAIAVGTLGVLYVLSNGEEISSFSDLEGKTIYATGQGSMLEYVLGYLIDKNGLSGKTGVEYKSEHSELATLMAAGEVKLAMLPQPFVTTVTMKNSDVKISLDLNEEWRKATGGQELTMTCIVVTNEFLRDNKQAVDSFLDEYRQSTDFVNNNVDEAAALSGKYDIVPEAVAKIAIPKCGIVYIDGDDMKTSVGPFYEVLFAANPAAVGGALPDDEFYYKR